jgi:hypothetical protein
MQGRASEDHGETRLSARAAITVWLILAGLVWGTVGVAINYSAHRGDDSLRAEAGPQPVRSR